MSSNLKEMIVGVLGVILAIIMTVRSCVLERAVIENDIYEKMLFHKEIGK